MFTFIVIILFGVMFLCSGIVINIIQVFNLLLVLPFSRRLYRVVNMILMDAYWSQLVWLVDTWGRLDIRIFTEPETMEAMGKEHAIVICNHRSDVDWVVGWVLAQRAGCLGGTRALMKQSVQFLPVIGWSLWFSEYIFLARNWAKDQKRMQTSYERLRDFPRALWLAVFVEGTRFTEAKLKAAQEYAASAGLPIPRNTLVPRTKGLVSAVQSLRTFVPVIYDMTAVVPSDVPQPTFLGLVERKPSVLHVHIRRIETADLPKDDAGIAEWCREAFQKKDDMLEAHKRDNTFGDELYLPMKPSLTPSLVTLGWAAGLTTGVAWLIKRAVEAHATLTWSGLAFLGVALVLVGVLMQRFLDFTQSEKSPATTKPKATATPPLDGAASNSKHPHSE